MAFWRRKPAVVVAASTPVVESVACAKSIESPVCASPNVAPQQVVVASVESTPASQSVRKRRPTTSQCSQNDFRLMMEKGVSQDVLFSSQPVAGNSTNESVNTPPLPVVVPDCTQQIVEEPKLVAVAEASSICDVQSPSTCAGVDKTPSHCAIKIEHVPEQQVIELCPVASREPIVAQIAPVECQISDPQSQQSIPIAPADAMFPEMVFYPEEKVMVIGGQRVPLVPVDEPVKPQNTVSFNRRANAEYVFDPRAAVSTLRVQQNVVPVSQPAPIELIPYKPATSCTSCVGSNVKSQEIEYVQIASPPPQIVRKEVVAMPVYPVSTPSACRSTTFKSVGNPAKTSISQFGFIKQ